MAAPGRTEDDGPERSAQANNSNGRCGDDQTSGGSTLRKLLEHSEVSSERQNPYVALWSKLWEADPPALPLQLAPGAPWPKVRRFIPSFLTSSLLHTAIVFFFVSIPFSELLAWLMGYPLPKKPRPAPEIVVEYRHLNLADYLPSIHPPGQGKAPGRGVKPGARPRLGATHFDPRISIISNPPNPDNFRLTLKTDIKPPTLKLPKDLKIPDFVSGGPLTVPAPPKAQSPAPEKAATPAPPKPTPAPPPVEAKAPAPPAVPIVPHIAPRVYAPPPPPSLALATQLPNIPVPQLEIPPPPPPVKTPSAEAGSGEGQPTPAASAAAPAAGKSGSGLPSDQNQPGGGPKIMALSTEPVPFTDLSQIPGGHHEGAFSIGPAGTQTGSPGGVPGGSPEAGEGGPGAGGDKSTAVGGGKGPLGGGGPGSGTGPSVSITGGGGTTGTSGGTLPPLRPQDLVYKVKPDAPKAHAPTMVVSSGASGGGGLRVYGVLHSDRIYTVYFSMPGKSWILQYCLRASAPPADPAAGTVQLTIPPALTPPAAIDQFDFQRSPDQQDSASGMIILHGTINDEGVVSGVTVLQGLEPTLDAAAVEAFSRWKFKPAMRAGAPVAIEFLVGIP